MNWEALGAIGELVGAVGVIATLAFLAFQIRQNSSLLKNNTRQLAQNHQVAIAQAIAQSDKQSDPMLVVAQSSELSNIMHRGLANFQSLPPEEAMRFSMAMGPIVAAVAVKMGEQRQLGVADEVHLPGQINFLMRFIDTDGGRQWWTIGKGMYPQSFIETVEEALKRRHGGAVDAAEQGAKL